MLKPFKDLPKSFQSPFLESAVFGKARRKFVHCSFSVHQDPFIALFMPVLCTFHSLLLIHSFIY